MILFNRQGYIKDRKTIQAEEAIYKEMKALIDDYKARNIPLIEVRAVIQCMIGEMSSVMMMFLKEEE